MKGLLHTFFIFCFSVMFLTTKAQVSGIAYKDYDASGTRTNTASFVEPLVAGITVRAYSASDVLLATTTTNNVGAYSFSGLTLPVRIEFSGLPATFLNGCATDNSGIIGSNVQFITAPTVTADYRINNPDDFCQNNPMVIRPQNYIGPATNNAGDGSLNGSYYNASNITDPVVNGGAIKEFSSNPATGATYGLAYSRKSKTLFNSAVIRNYFGTLADGYDDIYTFTFSDPSPATPSTATLTQGTTIDLSSLGVNMGADPRFNFTITGTTTYVDSSNLYRKVGKIGIGDIDVSSDGDTLFVVNMRDGAATLAIIHVKNPAAPVLIGNVAMPNPGCTNGTFRPWAVKYYQGHVYVGGVCDASTGTAANLQAYVYRYDGGTTYTQVATMPLNYTRGKATFRSDGNNQSANWRPWTDTWAPAQLSLGPDLVAQPQPILMDIEFLEDGSMVLGFGDRFSYQTAHGQRQYGVTSGSTFFSTVAAGDIVKFCNIGGVLTLETAAGACLASNTDNGSVTTLNPIGGAGGIKEYFDDDFYNTGTSSTGQAGHSETALGGLAVLPGANQLVAATFDPISTSAPGGTSGEVNTSGIRFYNTVNGNQVKGWIDFDQTFAGSNRKGGNLGDVEILCDGAPIEIGNRLWNDTNGNGIQDPGEPVFANVTVELYLDADNNGVPDGAALATVVTNARGEYIFSNQITTEVPGSGAKFNISQLVPSQTYIVRIGAADWNSATGEGAGDLADFHLTTSNVVGNGMADWSDSDASVVTNGGNQFAQISVTTGVLGSNDHNQDFGFKNTISLCGVVWNDVNGNATTVGAPDGPEAVINGTNAGGGITTGSVLYANLVNAGGIVIATTPINPDGTYCFPLVPQKTTGLTVQLTANQGTVGNPKPATTLPTGWVTTGENKNTQGGTADATPDSEIPVTTVITNITLQNFGLQQVPESAVHTEILGLNPGGTNCSAIDPIWFENSNVGSNPNTLDYNGGTVTAIRLTAFPSNATSITVNGTTYLATDPAWPANGGAGITIPYTPGTGPTQTVCVDPIDGVVSVVIPFASRDNAGKEDPTPGSVTVSYTAILPVNFISVMATKQSNAIAVTWIVGYETAVRNYEIERSADAVRFVKIGTAIGNGQLRYTFADAAPLAGVNFYRIKAIDLNGSFKYSTVIAISTNDKGKVQVYPNPVKDVVAITGLSGKGDIGIFGTDGKLIDRILVQSNTLTYDASRLKQGTYVLRYQDGDKAMQNIKIVKQ
jgi:hypothetical protein